MADTVSVKALKRYPRSSVLLYNGTTDAHFLLGGLGIIIGYDLAWYGWTAGLAYMVVAFAQMYLMMPMVVCPNCVYYRLEDGTCSMQYLRELCGLGETMQLASKCGLGQSAPNAFLSIVEHFQSEIMGRTNGVIL